MPTSTLIHSLDMQIKVREARYEHPADSREGSYKRVGRRRWLDNVEDHDSQDLWSGMVRMVALSQKCI